MPPAIPEITTATSDAVLTVTLDNPPDGLMTDAMGAALLAIVEGEAASEAVRCVILTGGVPGVFVRHHSGDDLLKLSNGLRKAGKTFDETSRVDDHTMNKLARALEALPKPVIAAINGHAMGGGCELAMACDIRIVEHGEFSIGLPEVNLGILPGAGGTQRLARLVGTARALDMILRGRTIAPAQAVSMGLAHELVEDALARANELASELAAKPPRAVAHAKRLVRAALPAIDPETLLLESRLFLDLVVSDDANTRLAALVAGERDIRDP
ncbi:MAG: enoyl-CoA hydratase/isomerase family protein [Alphaproteobacteria bacterium]|nr:enoyl-CoA hydratase/isomerase family protein [Alphaproteobacteria bacterium]